MTPKVEEIAPQQVTKLITQYEQRPSIQLLIELVNLKNVNVFLKQIILKNVNAY